MEENFTGFTLVCLLTAIITIFPQMKFFEQPSHYFLYCCLKRHAHH